jgi:hypothetical protein
MIRRLQVRLDARLMRWAMCLCSTVTTLALTKAKKGRTEIRSSLSENTHTRKLIRRFREHLHNVQRMHARVDILKLELLGVSDGRLFRYVDTKGFGFGMILRRHNGHDRSGDRHRQRAKRMEGFEHRQHRLPPSCHHQEISFLLPLWQLHLSIRKLMPRCINSLPDQAQRCWMMFEIRVQYL